jgi:hypothetical protein
MVSESVARKVSSAAASMSAGPTVAVALRDDKEAKPIKDVRDLRDVKKDPAKAPAAPSSSSRGPSFRPKDL